MRCVPVRDLANVTWRARLEVRDQWIEEASSRGATMLGCVAANAKPRLHEWPDEPRPYRALMVRPVPLAHVATVVTDVATLAGA
jgi:hypothetical protein